jgi:hypothetical protein
MWPQLSFVVHSGVCSVSTFRRALFERGFLFLRSFCRLSNQFTGIQSVFLKIQFSCALLDINIYISFSHTETKTENSYLHHINTQIRPIKLDMVTIPLHKYDFTVTKFSAKTLRVCKLIPLYCSPLRSSEP